jgi:eukaryotic-like serine/threonine-protein kinase
MSEPFSNSGPSMPFVPGVIVDGKYRLERPLARGGMGFVVLGRHVQLDQPVALKFMHAWLAHTVPKGAARFLDEARAAACLRSDYVARVSDTGTFQGSPYMVMEFLDGEDLEALLLRQPVLPVALAVRYALQASEGLGEAHAAGIIHRDLKPANLFLARRSDGSVRVKLLDFGISKMVGGVSGPNPAWDAADSPDAAEANAAICGSPLYMAPEQMLSSSKTDARTDIWALGVVLYEMLAGVRPFTGDTLADLCSRVLDPQPEPLRTLRPEVPVVLESAVMQCLQKDPDCRFQSVSAFAHALASEGAGGTRAAAARIDRIVQGRSIRPSASASSQAALATLVPEGPLTQTSFNRAVDGLADIMNVGGREARTSEVSQAEITPPPVAGPIVAPVIEDVDEERWLRPTLRTRILELRARLQVSLARMLARKPAEAPDPSALSVTGDSVLKRARALQRKRTAMVVAAGGGAAIALFFIAREAPSQRAAGTASAPAVSAPSLDPVLTVAASVSARSPGAVAAAPQPPPAPSVPAVPSPPAPTIRETPWVPGTVPPTAEPPAPPPARARASVEAPARAPAPARARAAATGRAPGIGGLAAPIGTAGFGGRE